MKASFGSRALAYLADLLVMAVLAGILTFILGSAIGLTAGRDSGLLSLISATLIALLGIALFALQFLYFGYLWSRDGQSIGMRWFNVRVVRQDGEALSFLRAALRGSAGYYISGLIFGLGFLWALWDRNSETWHDKLFGTWVVAAK